MRKVGVGGADFFRGVKHNRQLSGKEGLFLFLGKFSNCLLKGDRDGDEERENGCIDWYRDAVARIERKEVMKEEMTLVYLNCCVFKTKMNEIKEWNKGMK